MPDATRLSVNINQESAAALKEITERRGISNTEAIRRAIAIYKLIEEETANGNKIQIKDGKTVREIVMLA
ncbi:MULTISPECIES: ribbon-helix-helix protein, CopG family [Pseudofrankia]|uniref:ribbon-helix-helix protein, CopG family n=1 Tax=Pseudofrankia TaxID=2994363 RepID=UPI000234C7E9|nr:MULTISPECIES: ribbon-helix-helix protein, CopG family [Pseudofrankia]OHV27753.1 hypothetical protein BCD49_38625 [Pseudofrankia sp. EUN1h]